MRDLSFRLLSDRTEPLPETRVLRAADAARIRERIRAWNSEIAAVARERGAVVFDLAALFARLRLGGLPAAGRTLAAGAFGGFFSLDGFHPGATGYALIANELIVLVNPDLSDQVSFDRRRRRGRR